MSAWQTLKKLVFDSLTDPNDAYDIINLAAGCAFACGIVLEITDFAHHWHDPAYRWSVVEFMKAVGIGVAALGAAIRLRDGLPAGKSA